MHNIDGSRTFIIMTFLKMAEGFFGLEILESCMIFTLAFLYMFYLELSVLRNKHPVFHLQFPFCQ